jgi:hypothetical protein
MYVPLSARRRKWKRNSYIRSLKAFGWIDVPSRISKGHGRISGIYIIELEHGDVARPSTTKCQIFFASAWDFYPFHSPELASILSQLGGLLF